MAVGPNDESDGAEHQDRPVPSDSPSVSSSDPLHDAPEQFTDIPLETGPRGALWRAVDVLLLVGVAGMLLAVSLQVVSRLMEASFPWTEELTRYLFIWTTFLGLAAGFRTAEHARIGVVVAFLPRQMKRFAVHLYAWAGIAFFSVVAYKGSQLVRQQIRSGESSPVLGIGMYMVTSAVVVSAALAIIAHIQTVYRDRTVRSQLEDGVLGPQ
jgi:TRAP-type C4-dicarboxylate transport system permease small subunit